VIINPKGYNKIKGEIISGNYSFMKGETFVKYLNKKQKR
jgi:hypothetical protein